MNIDAEMLVGGDEILVLRLGELNVAGRVAKMPARERTGREVTQVIGRAEQDVGEDIGFAAKSPSGQGLSLIHI